MWEVVPCGSAAAHSRLSPQRPLGRQPRDRGGRHTGSAGPCSSQPTALLWWRWGRHSAARRQDRARRCSREVRVRTPDALPCRSRWSVRWGGWSAGEAACPAPRAVLVPSRKRRISRERAPGVAVSSTWRPRDVRESRRRFWREAFSVVKGLRNRRYAAVRTRWMQGRRG